MMVGSVSRLVTLPVTGKQIDERSRFPFKSLSFLRLCVSMAAVCRWGSEEFWGVGSLLPLLHGFQD